MALNYKKELEAIDPTVDYLMTLYLSPDLTPDEIRKAKKAGIVGTFPLPKKCATIIMTTHDFYRRQIISSRSNDKLGRWHRII